MELAFAIAALVVAVATLIVVLIHRRQLAKQ